MTDHELTEAAAKAMGIAVTWEPAHGCYWIDLGQGLPIDVWEPLEDDAQALRLGARTGVFFKPEFAHFLTLERFAGQAHDDIRAHRRAITRAAAALAVSDLAKMEGAK